MTRTFENKMGVGCSSNQLFHRHIRSLLSFANNETHSIVEKVYLNDQTN